MTKADRGVDWSLARIMHRFLSRSDESGGLSAGRLRIEGLSLLQIAKRLNTSTSSVARLLRAVP